jgi:hypothetical protein
VQFTGHRIAVRMCGVATGQGSVEVADADGVEFLGELVVGDTGLDQGQGATGVAQHVGVGTDRDRPGAWVPSDR